MVTEWEDARETGASLTAVNGPTFLELDEVGRSVLIFDGQQQLEGLMGQDLGDATIIVRLKVTGPENDTDFIYSAGNDGAAGHVMSLSHGGDLVNPAVVTDPAQSYHFDGANSHYGDGIYSDRYVTVTQVFYGSPTSDGVQHRLFIDGVDANLSGASAPYSVLATDPLVVGAKLNDASSGFEGEISEILIYDRAMEYWEHSSAASYVWNWLR